MAQHDPLADEIVRLYGLPPTEFVAARNATAKALRSGGRKDDAARIAALRKPSVVESAVNRTAQRNPDVAATWAAATRAASEAQSATIGGSDAAGLRAAVRDLRSATDAMVDAAVATVADESKRDDIATLLRAMPVGAVDQVVAGVLGSADRPEDELFAGAPAPPPRPPRRPASRERGRASRSARDAPAPPEPEPPSERELELTAAVPRLAAALADAATALDTARAEAAEAHRRLEGAEAAHAAAGTALADAQSALRTEQERRTGGRT